MVTQAILLTLHVILVAKKVTEVAIQVTLMTEVIVLTFQTILKTVSFTLIIAQVTLVTVQKAFRTNRVTRALVCDTRISLVIDNVIRVLG